MKKLIITSILALLVTAGTTLKAQNRPDEYLGLPGDNLNLYAVMKLFQESETLEGFERSLNDENNRINNLDLNGDNLVDYIMVTDYVDGDVHNIVLQVALNRNEKQDVAVFTVQRFRDGSAQIQLIGDEALYGRNYIIEPIYDDNVAGTPNPGYNGGRGNSGNITVVRTTAFEIAAWPLVRFIYRPNYVIWHSSWNWGYYPSYWHSWSPFYWDYYYGYHRNWYSDYYTHYRHWENPRYTRYNDFYYSSRRSHSPIVTNRIKEGNYKATYSHPEQRRDGEALYTKMHSGQNSRSTGNRTTTNQERRSVSQSNRDRTISGTNSGTSRRSANTSINKSRTNPSSGQNAGTSGRSTTTVNDRKTSNPSSGQKAGSSRRSSSNVPDRAVSRSGSGQKGETVRTPRQSKKSVSTSNRRSNKENKKGNAVKGNDNSKNSETGKSSRR